jgi:microcystin degradation protein MlrC
MVTAQHPDADGEVLHQLRNVLGPNVPIIATLDFHANVSIHMVESADALIGYQTYPHVDQRQCGLAAAAMIIRQLRDEIRPAMALVKPPLIINLLGQETEREPMRSLMERARRSEQEPGMLSVSVMAGFPYADVYEMGPAIIAVSDGDRSRAQAVAEDLEERMWNCRGAIFVPCLGPSEAVTRALASKREPVVLVDLGDNVGGGSAGDGTVLLEELIRRDVEGAVIVLYDPAAVAEACRAGLGGEFEGFVGGKTDRWHGEPVLLRGTVGCLHGGAWVEDEPRHGGHRHNDQGPTAVIETRTGTLVVLDSLRTPPFSLGQLTSLGIDPASRSILVLKAAVAYKAAYAPIAAEVIEVDTPGLTAIDPARFTYQHRRRPLFPLDPMVERMTTEGDL